MPTGSVSNVVVDTYKTSVNDISPFYANDIIDQLQPKTFVAKISNGNGLINPTPPNYTHGFLVKDLEDIQTDISNNYPENQLTSIPDLVYQYDSTRKEINQTVLIPVMVKSIQSIKQRIFNLEEDTIVILLNIGGPTSEYVTLKTEQAIIDTLTAYISSLNVYKLTNNRVDLLVSTILGNNDNSSIYLQIINAANNQNKNVQQVRISNERKNVILKTFLTQIVIQNLTLPITPSEKIMLDLGLLPVGPSTLVLTREYIGPQPQLVRLISAYSSIPAILTRTYIVTETDNECIIGMDIDDYIQIQFQYEDSTQLSGKAVKNLLYIKKTDTYSYEIKELDDPDIITDKKEIVTNEVTITYLNNNNTSEFTFYYVLGSFASYGITQHNIIS